MTLALAPLIDQWIDGTLDEEGARVLAAALGQEPARREILHALEMHGLLAGRDLSADADGIVRSVMERLRAEERADEFVADFWRNSLPAEAATAGTFSPNTKTNATFAPRARPQRRQWVAVAACAGALVVAATWARRRPTEVTGSQETSSALEGQPAARLETLQLADSSWARLGRAADASAIAEGSRLLVRAGSVRIAFAATPPADIPAARVVFPDGSELAGAGATVDVAVSDNGVSVHGVAGVAWLTPSAGGPPLEVAVGHPASIAWAVRPAPARPSTTIAEQNRQRKLNAGGLDPSGAQALSARPPAEQVVSQEITFAEARGDGRWSRTRGWIQQSELSELPGRHDRAPIWKGPVDVTAPLSFSAVLVADRHAREGFFTLGALFFWPDAPMVGCHVVGRAGGGRVVRLEAFQRGSPAPPFANLEDFPWQPVAPSRGDAYRLRLDVQPTPKVADNGRKIVRVRCQAWPVDEAEAPMEWGPAAELALGERLTAVALRTYRAAGRFKEVVVSPTAEAAAPPNERDEVSR